MIIEPTSRPATIMELYTNNVYCIKNNDGGFTPAIEKKLLEQIDAPSTNISKSAFPKVPFKYKVYTFWHQHGTKIIVGAGVVALIGILVSVSKNKKEEQAKP
jgi:hypothetical protein